MLTNLHYPAHHDGCNALATSISTVSASLRKQLSKLYVPKWREKRIPSWVGTPSGAYPHGLSCGDSDFTFSGFRDGFHEVFGPTRYLLSNEVYMVAALFASLQANSNESCHQLCLPIIYYLMASLSGLQYSCPRYSSGLRLQE